MNESTHANYSKVSCRSCGWGSQQRARLQFQKHSKWFHTLLSPFKKRAIGNFCQLCCSTLHTSFDFMILVPARNDCQAVTFDQCASSRYEKRKQKKKERKNDSLTRVRSLSIYAHNLFTDFLYLLKFHFASSWSMFYINRFGEKI